MKFDYSKIPAPDGKILFRAILPILFKNGAHFVFVDATVDSGADCTILPIELAKELNLKLDPKEAKKFFGAGNNSFKVYPSPQPIEIILRQSGFRTIKCISTVYFAESQSSILLGNIGFLDQIKITLDGVKKELKIDTPKS